MYMFSVWTRPAIPVSSQKGHSAIIWTMVKANGSELSTPTFTRALIDPAEMPLPEACDGVIRAW